MSTKPPFRNIVAAASLSLAATSAHADPSPEEIRESYLSHAALTQFHRWYLIYERPGGGIDNALDILAPDVRVVSGLGEANGHEDYAARVAALPETWRNAHFPQDVSIEPGADGAMTLTARITYLNQGMLPDGAVRTADLTYRIGLVPGEGLLPKLGSVEIAQEADGTAEMFTDAYAENRMKSLMHYWLALIEDPARDAEPIREILAPEFALNFSSGKITDFDGVAAWLAGPASQVAASMHVPVDFTARERDGGVYELSVTFDWTGILPNGDLLVAKTRHRWTAEDDVTERFARIRSMDVEVLEPFRPKPD